MASDLPPFLSHSPHRNIAWTGHGAFPYRSIKMHEKLDRKHSGGSGYLKDLRIFEWEATLQSYKLMSEEKIEAYMGEISG